MLGAQCESNNVEKSRRFACYALGYVTHRDISIFMRHKSGGAKQSARRICAHSMGSYANKRRLKTIELT